MKLNKKAVTFLAFTVGACVFVSTALADQAIGSGYDQLKATAKTTAAQMESGLDNYTIETLYTLKDNGKALVQNADVLKIDNARHAKEEQSTRQTVNGKTTSRYSYSDPKRTLWKNGTENKYYEENFANNPAAEHPAFSDPFKRNGAPEMEKIVDALVGNLKDNVQAHAGSNGGKVYSGSLSESQVPTLVNAVASFFFEQRMFDRGRAGDNNGLPDMKSDVYVKKVTGRAEEDKAGLLENVTGDIVLSGKDGNGVQHDLDLNVVFKLSDIGTTKVSVPDLTGKNVQEVSKAGSFSNAYVGTYKSNIVMQKDGKFVKIGERTLDITSVKDGKVTGKYSETVKPGYEADYPSPYRFTLTYDPASTPMSLFSYTNPKGEQEQGRLTPGGNGKVYLELNIKKQGKNAYSSGQGLKYFDGEFTRVFAN